jgi:CRISPR system Cascade subunit CasB
MTMEATQTQPAAAGPPLRLHPQAAALIDQLTRLVVRDDRGALAQLRRSAGKEPGEAEGVFRYVVPYLPDPPDEWLETCRYLVAGLFALHPPALQPNKSVAPMPGDSLGAALNRMAPQGAGNREAVERRFAQLLVADREELPDRLRQAIQLLRSAGEPVGWPRLLADLEQWNLPRRPVQRRWAQDFWRLPEREAGDDEPAAQATTTA